MPGIFDDNAGVMAAEAKRIAQGGPDGFDCGFRKVKFKPGSSSGSSVKWLMVGGILSSIRAHHTGNGLDDAGRAQAMSGHTFGAADIDGVEGSFAEYVDDSLYLGGITEWGRSSVCIDIVDVGRFQPGIGEGGHHDIFGAQPFGMGRSGGRRRPWRRNHLISQ
jgi:hypothetical protein